MQGKVINGAAVNISFTQFVTRYNYDVVWHSDGIKYIRHMQEEIDGVSEGDRAIWGSMNNQKFSPHSPEEIEKQSIQEFNYYEAFTQSDMRGH